MGALVVGWIGVSGAAWGQRVLGRTMVRWYVSICAWIFLPYVLFVVACNFSHTVDSP
jgi:hypothetical protein